MQITRWTHIELPYCKIIIKSEDEPKLIQALTSPKDFTPFNFDEWHVSGDVRIKKCCDTCEVMKSGSGEACIACDNTLNLWRTAKQ